MRSATSGCLTGQVKTKYSCGPDTSGMKQCVSAFGCVWSGWSDVDCVACLSGYVSVARLHVADARMDDHQVLCRLPVILFQQVLLEEWLVMEMCSQTCLQQLRHQPQWVPLGSCQR